MLMGDFLDSGQIVGHYGSDALPSRGGNSLYGLLPTRSAFSAWEQQRIKESSLMASTRLQGHQVQDPRYSLEFEPQAIGEQYQRSSWNLLWLRPSEPSLQSLTESIPIGR